MFLSGTRIVLLCCFLVHFVWVHSRYFELQLCSDEFNLLVEAVQAITHLCYPVLGFLGDRWFSHYSLMLVSIATTMFIGLFGVVVLIVSISIIYINPTALYLDSWYGVPIVSLPLVATIVTLGMFEANAIQFGMHQMLEANSYQLSTFIHWYYWSIHASRGLMVLVSVGVEGFLRSCLIDLHINNQTTQLVPTGYVLLPLLLIQTVMSAVGVYLLRCNKRHLNIDPAGHTALTTVYKVLQYAWKHKCPENRSALTYWENDIPPRIDLGKSKYGGPFTTEEVEDVKTLFRILLLLLTLAGIQLAGNGYSVTSLLVHKLCPSAITFLSLLYAPNILSSASIIVIVPLLHYVILPYFSKYVPNMLHRMGLCLAVILIQEIAGVLVAVEGTLDYRNCLPYPPNIREAYFMNTYFLVNGTCTRLQVSSTSQYHCAQGDTLFLWLLLPIALQSFAYQFAFMTALEFICAQAPLRMKGLLIGLWYSTSLLQIHNSDRLVVEDFQWLISHGVKCLLIFLLLVFYCCIVRCYHYRVRDEVVPIYTMIEDRYEREIQQREEYEREHGETREFLDNSSVPNYGTT